MTRNPTSDATPLRPTEPAPGSPAPAGNPDTFTRGPWYGDGRERETGDILVYAPEAKHGCRDICFIPEDDEQDAANARLIASAPDLLEALERLARRECSSWCAPSCGEHTASCKAARAAIRKARGQHD
jgi:hypothetical protein